MPITDAQGLSLSADIASTLDSPPYDKSMMDGFAVMSADILGKPSDDPIELTVQEEIMAGQVPRSPLAPGCATRIMTGAPLPEAADAVVMLEESAAGEPRDGTTYVQLRPQNFRKGQNILPRGASMKVGDTVLRQGDALTPAVIGLLAEMGFDKVDVCPPPRVAALSTGDELVDFTAQPAAGQIRNSNGPMLAAQIRAARAIPIELGIARDNESALRNAISRGIKADILLLSGGVSAGDLDLVPGVLQSLGVRQVFHKVFLKPGKPLWFGVRDSDADRSNPTLVFGLPGNPVSSFVCFELFVRPAIRKLMGRRALHRQMLSFPLAEAYTYRGGRPVYLPAVTEESEEGPCVRVLAWRGSADLRRLAEANALIQLSQEAREYASGDSVPVLSLFED
ncbi:MAG: molybdopterin molybdotransferase MoeA [Pirellulales bacterium]|nr:molybdopterin molybdotransferase MoeA [Pirellulales bacterium]